MAHIHFPLSEDAWLAALRRWAERQGETYEKGRGLYVAQLCVQMDACHVKMTGMGYLKRDVLNFGRKIFAQKIKKC